MRTLEDFRLSLNRPGIVEELRQGIIGDGLEIETPFGGRQLVYADYVASGRALRQVESFVAEAVLPYYANSHTEASFCGSAMTRMRREARQIIAEHTGADNSCAVIFTGQGATSAVNRLVALLDLKEKAHSGTPATILIGPYEHHSNILPWRESGSRVIEIAEAPEGGVDPDDLISRLEEIADGTLIVGSFSAASNVTGQTTDVAGVSRILKKYGALSIWDYAGGGPYLPITMYPAPGCAIDALFFSPHKFIGGPGSSGVLVLRRDTFCKGVPSAPGGGTVTFVSPWDHRYSQKVETREESGTPNVIGDIRAAAAVVVKSAIGQDYITRRDKELREFGAAYLKADENIELLGKPEAAGLPIFSFRVRCAGKRVHHQLFTRMLSDVYGIQVRGGCACAGPYGHRLLGIDQAQSEALFASIDAGQELEKPGWVRFNFSFLHSDSQVRFILESISELARDADHWGSYYNADPKLAQFKAVAVKEGGFDGPAAQFA